MIRALIIDDSAYNRRTIKAILESSGEVHVIGTARDGEEGLKKAFELKPDAITLDLQMPQMDGFTFLRIMMKHQPTPVIVVSSKNEDTAVFKALELGAVDFIPKPSMKASPELYSLREELLAKILAIEKINMRIIQRRLVDLPVKLATTGDHPLRTKVKERTEISHVPSDDVRFKAVAIGASTGGPSALQTILSDLPGDIGVAIAVSQHMPPGFTRAFAERLDRYTSLQVKEAESGDLLSPGWVLIAPGGYNLYLQTQRKEVKAVLRRRRAEDRYVPSVDIMFNSAAEVFKERLLGIVLTGMGNDGKEGLKEIKKRGGRTLAESSESAVIFGMPRVAIEGGSVDRIVPLSHMSQEIIGWSGKL